MILFYSTSSPVCQTRLWGPRAGSLTATRFQCAWGEGRRCTAPPSPHTVWGHTVWGMEARQPGVTTGDPRDTVHDIEGE